LCYIFHSSIVQPQTRQPRSRTLGVDIQDPAFWQKGFDEISGLLTRLKESI
jgi:hypothetical protein